MARPLQEQATGVLAVERVEPPHGLAVDLERLTAGREHPNLRAGTEQDGGQLRALVDHVLAVVEHEQHIALG